MKKFNKVAAAVLCVVMTMSLLAGCGSSNTGKSSESSKASSSQASQASSSQESPAPSSSEAEAPVEITYPLDTDVKLRIYVKGGMTLSSNYTDFDETPFAQGLEERTGVDIEWETAPTGSEATAAYNLLLQEENLPHIIMGSVCSPASISQLLEDEVVMDISELLPVYAPNFWEYINGDSAYQQKNRQMMLQEVVGLTHFIGTRDVADNNVWRGMMIRQDWLDEQKLEMPETIEEFENVLRVFKEKYGAVFSGTLGGINGCGFVASGLGSMAALSASYYVEDGEVKNANMQPEWKEFLILMNKWYKEGLIDANFTGIQFAAVRSGAAEGKYGIIVCGSGDAKNFVKDAKEKGNGANWVGMPYLKDENGKVKFAQNAYSTWAGSQGAYVTNSCTEEEAIVAIEFLDYWFSEEGITYVNFGEEGVSYELDAAGNPVYTSLIMDDPRGVTPASHDYTAAYNTPVGIQLHSGVEQRFLEDYSKVTAEWTKYNDAAEYIQPTLVYTDDESKRQSDLSSALSTYISEQAMKFVVGEISLDTFDSFVETLKSMGMQELLDIRNAAYQRYLAKE